MSKPPHYLKNNEMPWAFMAAIILFLIVPKGLFSSEAFWNFAVRYSRPTTDYAFRYEAQLRAIPDKKTEKRRVIMIGSSSLQNAIDTKYLNNQFPADRLRFYKVSLPFCYPAEIFQQRKRLSRKQADVIVIDLTVAHIYTKRYGMGPWGGVRRYNRIWPFIFDISIVPYMIRHLGLRDSLEEVPIIEEGLIYQCSELLRYRHTIKYLVGIGIRNLWRRAVPNDGEYHEFNQMSRRDYDDLLAKIGGNSIYSKGGLTDFNQDLFESSIRFFKDRGLKIIILDIPRNPILKKAYDENIDREFVNYMNRKKKELGFAFLSSSEFPEFLTEDFYDLMHMDESGRVKMSRFITSYFNKHVI